MWILRSRPFLAAMLILCVGTGYLCVTQVKEYLSVRAIHDEHERGIDLYKEGRYEEAMPLIEQAIARDPGRADLYRIAAHIADRTGKMEDLRRYGKELSDRVSGREAALMHFQLGLLDLNGTAGVKPDLAGAIGHFQTAVKEDESLTDARAALGIALSLKGDTARARPELDRAWADAERQGPGQFARTARLWAISDMLRRQEPLDAWVAFHALYPTGPPVDKNPYVVPIALALAFRANAPDLSGAVRSLCLTAAGKVPADVRERYSVQLNTIAAEALDRLGFEQDALDAYRKAYEDDPAKSESTRRSLAYALHMAAARTEDKGKATEAEKKSLGLYRELLASGSLGADEKRQLAMALATRLWNDGQTEDALKLVESAGDPASLVAVRMRIAIAFGKKDFKEASAQLHEAQKLDPNQPDVAALLKRLTLPPEVMNFRVNSWGRYDPRPILSAAILPRALPIPIAKDKISMKLDGEAIQPLHTQGEVFYRPMANLEPGEHHVEIAATDSLGLSVTKTLSFSIDIDKDPPRIVGLTPPDKGTASSLQPLIGCRCTDPSGIDDSSLTVSFSGHAGKPSHPVHNVTIIDKGRFALDFPALGIKKGAPVHAGAVAFQFPDPLGEGECSVRVGVSDVRGNRAVKTWTFKVTAPPAPKEPRKK